MKLLSRPEASAQASQQRKEQADSGIYIAGRVDRLRITLQELETQQSDFIRNNQKAIDEALADGFSAKSRLEGEIKVLEAKMQELRKPLDSEWERLLKDRSELDAMTALESTKTALLDSKLNDSDKLISEAEKDRQRASIELENASSDRKKAFSFLKESKEISSAASERSLAMEKSLEQSIKEAGEERKRAEYDRKHYRDFEKELRKREKTLSERETRAGIIERKHADRQ